MATFALLNDQIVTVTIHTEDASGNLVPAPAGDTFTVVSDNPGALNVVMGTDSAGSPAVVMNALVPLFDAPGIKVTTSDSAGLLVSEDMITIVADDAPRSIVLDFTDATHTSQPVPVAPTP
jgi:hypothetical protein